MVLEDVKDNVIYTVTGKTKVPVPISLQLAASWQAAVLTRQCIYGKDQGLADSPGYKEAIDFVKQQARIRELFFGEIRSRTEPDPQQTNETLNKSLHQIPREG